jgi:hypothetical protein
VVKAENLHPDGHDQRLSARLSPMNICVHTSLGRRGEAEPHVFFVGGHRLIVAGIRERWVDHPHRYYEVTCDDGRGFLLRFDTSAATWELAGVYAPRFFFNARFA